MIRAKRAHRDDKVAGERTGRLRRDIRPIHADIASLFHVSDGDTLVDESLLPAEGTANGERDQVVTPDVANVGHLFNQNAIAEHPIPGHVAANIDAVPQRRQRGIAGFSDRQERAWLRVALTEREKIERASVRKNDQIGLEKTR
jgi:hypothetical protein